MVSFTELMDMVFLGALAFAVGLVEFVLPVLLGNTIGGIALVTVGNSFQTSERCLVSGEEQNDGEDVGPLALSVDEIHAAIPRSTA